MDKRDWERLEGETDAAFTAFAAYRDLGVERSLVLAYQTVQGKAASRAPGHWHEWSTKYHWVARASAYDDFLDAQRRGVREKVRREHEERRFRFELGHQARLEQLVDKMTETANVAMDATIRAAKPPEPRPASPADALLQQLGLDEEGNPLPPPEPPKPPNVKVNVSGLGRFIQEIRNTAREAACGVWPLQSRPAVAEPAQNAIQPGAELVWDPKPNDDPPAE